VSALLVVQLVAVFATGLIAGILFGDRAGNTYARIRLTPEGFVAFQREQNKRFTAMMPLPILAAVVASASWLVMMRDRVGTTAFWLAAAGTVANVLVVAITRIVNIPINNRVDAGQAEPVAVRRLWPRWERAHTVRTGIALVAFACELVALALERAG
jgi:uncharacterized membrane protein